MKIMKKVLSVIICLVLISSNFIFIYASEDVGEFKNIEEEHPMILKLDKLNLYNPIKFINIYDNFYSYEIFNLLFNYGNVNIIITEIGVDNIIIDSLLNADYDSSLIKLEPNKKYIYDISIMQDEFVAMSFYGEIVTGETINDLVNCELLKFNDNTILQHNIDILATMSESEPNNTFSTANTIYDNYDVNGVITTVYDVDYYKIQFSNSGKANFWLGNISSGSNLDLYVYNENQQLLYSSNNSSNSQELINNKVVVGGKWYYIKVITANSNVSTPASYQINAKFFEVAKWPAVKKQINYCFPCRYYPGHRGIDIAAVTSGVDGDNIYAILDGTVIHSGWHDDSGYHVVIRHTGSYPLYDNSSTYISSRYFHLMQQSSLNVGDVVRKGDIIGKMGNTGPSQGTHLHLEVTQHNNLNPSLWSGVLIDPGKNFYPEVKCNACGNHPIVPYNNDELNIFNKPKTAGMLINNRYFIDVRAFEELTFEELQKYGINAEDLSAFVKVIYDNIEFSTYIDYIYNLINEFKN